MPIRRAAAYRRMPWKNGGGETVEIAIAPDGAGLDTFDWRVSTATVATDGPFSVFAGVDRTLCLIDGAGLALRIDNSRQLVLDAASDPLTFTGEAAVSATLVNGAITDFNVMTRRSRYRHTVRRVHLDRDRELICDPAVTIVFAHAGIIVVTNGIDTQRLEPFDAFVRDATEPGVVTMHASVPSVLYLVTISAT